MTGRGTLLPALVVALAVVAVVAVVAGCGRPVQGNGQNVLLISLETTRSDHLGSYGYARDTSPALDELAARGVRFENTSSVSPRTNPSLASLMTSRYPHEHGVRNLLLPLEPENRTLAEALRDAGYDTAAVQTHPRLVRGSGLEQGFRDYRDDWEAHPTADGACGVAESWIADRSGSDRPWFLWLHLMDPHWTYDPPAAWREAFGPEHPTPSRVYRALADRRIVIGPLIHGNRMTADEIQGFVDLYDAEIRFTDHELGSLLERLRASGSLANTVIVVTADHGESLGEHGYHFEHGDFGTEPEIRIPLILAGPDLRSDGVAVPATVSNLDVAPTVLDLVGVAADPSFRGRTLRPLWDGSESGDRTVFGETGKRFHEENTRREVEGPAGKWRWLRRGHLKLVHRPRADGTAERVLYDLGADPGETVDASQRYPAEFTRMGLELDALLAEDVGPVRDYHISEEAREQLRSLGYVN